MSEFNGTGGKWYRHDVAEYAEIVSENNRVLAMVANAHDADLIAEAGTVRNETGFSPRELAAHRKSLLDALRVTVKWMEWWLTNDLCECEAGHICGKTQREEELETARAAIAEATNAVPLRRSVAGNDGNRG